MHRPAGFTIVEIAIAVAVTVLIAAMVVPRYNAAIVNQEFLGEAQRVVECFQEAQSMAVAPVPALFIGQAVPRYVSARFETDGTGQWECEIAAYGSNLSSFTYAPAGNRLANPRLFSGADILKSDTDFQVYFDAANRGMPAAVVDGIGGARFESLSNGLFMVTTLVSPRTSNATAELQIGASGTPIKIVTP